VARNRGIDYVRTWIRHNARTVYLPMDEFTGPEE